MTGLLAGRVAVVTGAASGIGAATAARLASDGARVACVDIDLPGAVAVAERVQGIALECDVSDGDAVDTVVAEVFGRLGPIDLLANVAGVAHAEAVAAHSENTWRAVMGVNLDGPFHTIRSVLQAMMDRGFGRIVNVSSGSATRPTPGAAAYAASKAALVALTKTVAMEGAGHGVTANAVAPGLVDSPMTRRLMPTDAELARMASDSAIANPMGVALVPDDVASAVAFFMDPRNAHVTGQTLHVNAGAQMP